MPLIIDHATTLPVRRVPRRRFVIAQAKTKDVRRLVDIEFSAFEHERANQVLSFRDNKNPLHFERSVSMYADAIGKQRDARRRASLRKHGLVELDIEGREVESSFDVNNDDDNNNNKNAHHTATSCFRTVINTETGETVSFVKFEMKLYSKAELAGPADIGHEHEPQMNRDWFALNEVMRREYIGLAPHCYIGMLATEPKYQHHGAGTMLLLQILGEADAAGVQVYLEATDTAKPLYERHGFVAVQELRFNPGEYGVRGVGTERQTIMVRGALGCNGVRGDVRSWEAATNKARLACF